MRTGFSIGTEDIKEFCVATTGFASKRYLNKDDIGIATRNW